MSVISMKSYWKRSSLWSSTRKWNPKMSPYIFTARNGIHIIDLQKTVQKTKEAYEAMRELTSQGKQVLFVGTKKQARATVEEEAKKCNMHFVTNRWLGGLLTNWPTIKKSINRLKKLEQMFENDTLYEEASTKKEILYLKREYDKKQKSFGGIKNLTSPPDILFVIDPSKEDIAVKEATKLGITIFGIVDTNCNPELIDYPMPGNDDAIRSINLFLKTISSAIIEGTGGSVEQLKFNEEIDLEQDNLEYQGEYDEFGNFILDEDVAKSSKQEAVVAENKEEEKKEE